ncbi:hypothetical protein J6590_089521 [Homalodisca vitripennis]|nr:hypothetical protein J6590_089521 [Homalodisca vitripennis]
MKRHYSMELNIFVFLFLSHQGAAHTKRYLMNDVMQETPTPGAGPTFDTSVPGNLTGLVGKTAYLNCRVKNLGNRTVSWVRHRDIHLLTVGRYTYTSDQRFESVHSPHTEDWTLRIRYPQKEDSGTYECQISTTPPVGHPVYLSIVEPTTEIIGGPEMYINIGSTINLTCVVSFAPEPPPTVLWRHNRKLNGTLLSGSLANISSAYRPTESRVLLTLIQEIKRYIPYISFDICKLNGTLLSGSLADISSAYRPTESRVLLTLIQEINHYIPYISFDICKLNGTLLSSSHADISSLINFENSRGGISLVTEKGVVTRSRLLIQKADKADNGIYSCDPSTAAAATIHVHILNGEHPAAMHHGHGNSHLGPPMLAAFLLPILTNIFVNGLVL